MQLGQDPFARRGGDEIGVEAFDDLTQRCSSAACAAAGDDHGTLGTGQQVGHAPHLLCRYLRSGRRQRSCGRREHLDRQRRILGEQIERYAEVRGTHSPGRVLLEHAAQKGLRLLGAARGAGEIEHGIHHTVLVLEFMQQTPAAAERSARRRARDDDHRHRIRPCLRDGGERVGDAGSGDDEGRRRTTGHACIAVGGESCALLVPREHMAHIASAVEPAVEREVVHARDAEHGVDAVRGQQVHDVTSEGSCC